MPDILAHLICGNLSIKNLNSNIKEIITTNQNLFNLGTQGPDIFFYHKIYPWQNSGNIFEFANLIHSTKTSKFFINSIKIIKKQIEENHINFFKTENKTTDAHKQFAYIAGFLTHYALDTKAHPYIFYFSGVNSSHNHKYFECIIDTILANVYDAKKMKLFKTSKVIKLKNYDINLVGNLLNKIGNLTFNVDIPTEATSTSIKDIKSIMAIMYDPRHLKRATISLVDKVTKLKGKMKTASFPAKLDPNVDYLNLKHRKWFHPCNDEIMYTDSFLQLFDKSITRSEDLILHFSMLISDKITDKYFSELHGNLLYDTGLEESIHQEMFFENIILDYRKVFKI